MTEQRANQKQSGEDEDHHVPAPAGFLGGACDSRALFRRGRGDCDSRARIVDGFGGSGIGICGSEGGLHLRDGGGIRQLHADRHAAARALDPVLVAVGQICCVGRRLKTDFGSATRTSGVHSFLLSKILYTHIINGYADKVKCNPFYFQALFMLQHMVGYDTIHLPRVRRKPINGKSGEDPAQPPLL